MVMRKLAVVAIVVGGVFLALSRRHRTLLAQKLAESRRFVSQRIIDRNARNPDRERDRWDNEGGALG